MFCQLLLADPAKYHIINVKWIQLNVFIATRSSVLIIQEAQNGDVAQLVFEGSDQSVAISNIQPNIFVHSYHWQHIFKSRTGPFSKRREPTELNFDERLRYRSKTVDIDAFAFCIALHASRGAPAVWEVLKSRSLFRWACPNIPSLNQKTNFGPNGSARIQSSEFLHWLLYSKQQNYMAFNGQKFIVCFAFSLTSFSERFLSR